MNVFEVCDLFNVKPEHRSVLEMLYKNSSKTQKEWVDILNNDFDMSIEIKKDTKKEQNNK